MLCSCGNPADIGVSSYTGKVIIGKCLDMFSWEAERLIKTGLKIQTIQVCPFWPVFAQSVWEMSAYVLTTQTLTVGTLSHQAIQLSPQSHMYIKSIKDLLKKKTSKHMKLEQ